MRDMGTSDNPLVQAQLDRLGGLSIQRDTLGLEAVGALLDRLGNPHHRLPPVFHVAGTNGKGSTCAFLRAMLEAQGLRVHVTTSPHLVRYNERFRIAGSLIEDARLAAVLEDVLDAAGGLGCSFFEITVAAVFMEFARVPADACVVEVGLGGRLDATNVLPDNIVAASGIAALGIDHERFLLAPEDGVPDDPLARIAFEKAGIVKTATPLVTMAYTSEAQVEVERAAMANAAPLAMRGQHWRSSVTEAGLHYADRHGELVLPLPSLPGDHQAENAALAAAMVRHQDRVQVSARAIGEGISMMSWPGRLQRLPDGALADVPVYLDGGHNVDAAKRLAEFLGQLNHDNEGNGVHLILGMLDAKDLRGFLAEMAPHLGSLVAVPITGHDHFAPAHIAAVAREMGVEHTAAAPNVPAALESIRGLQGPSRNARIVIGGSLYLAGEVLRLANAVPD